MLPRVLLANALLVAPALGASLCKGVVTPGTTVCCAKGCGQGNACAEGHLGDAEVRYISSRF